MKWPTRYAIALAPTILVTLFRDYLPDLANVTPAVFNYPAVFLATWLGGFLPGLISTLACSIHSLLFIRPHLLNDLLSDPPGIARSLMFPLTCFLFLTLVALLEKALTLTLRAINLRDEFISLASHELRTPLTSIKLGLEVLKAETLENQHLTQVIKKIDKQATRQEKLISSMIDLTLIDSGQFKLFRENVDLKRLVENAAISAMDSLGEKDFTLSLDTVEGYLDPARLEQTVFNVVHNAVKYGEKGTVKVELRNSGSEAMIRISNRGYLIPDFDQSLIFKRFERPFNQKMMQGLGTGLYLARYMTELHGGSLILEQNDAEETIFKILLPLK